MFRGSSRYAPPGRRAGSVLLVGGRSSSRRRRRRRLPTHRRRRFDFRRLLGWTVVLAVLAGIAAGAWYWRSQVDARHDRRQAARTFAAAWAQGDWGALWRALTPASRKDHPQDEVAAAYDAAKRAAGIREVRIQQVGAERDGRIALTVAVETLDFGIMRGTIHLPVSGGPGDDAGVRWNASLRLPGLGRGEAVRRRLGTPQPRAEILAADGTRLDATPLGASIAGHARPEPTGLERIYDRRLAGHPDERLLFGTRVVARSKAVRGRPVRTTIRPELMEAAASSLGDRLGGVAVIRPSDGAVLAVAGLAVSAPQPPGSTFKIITASAALKYRRATPSTTYPVRTFATLSGVKLRNASDEACGGTLTEAFIESCNSVFAPLGAKVGAKQLVATAEAFGFGERPPIPALAPSTISPPSELLDDLAVGSAAIGQERDLATPLEMASVGATIATNGRRARPRMTTAEPVRRKRVVSARVAGQVREMMLGVVRSGTGTAAAIPGVSVAGKTGTAELRPNSKDPKDADAWFVAFAPAERPRVAVAVMLVGAGFGGTAAAPIARRVLQAAL